MNSIKTLIQEGQHEQQAFIMHSDDQLEIARILASFANTKGGRLLIGVKDNGKITGILPEEAVQQIEKIARFSCQPAIHFTSQVWQEDFRLVLEIQVAQDPNRFITAKNEEGEWKSYIRIKGETVKANKIQLKLWKLKGQSIEKPTVLKDREKDCLTAISNHLDSVNLTKLYKLLDLYSKKDVDNSLALLIHWKIVDWNYDENGFKYFITNY